jgi:hypothetical protein
MRILLVNQIQEEGSSTLDLSVTQYVVQSDARREMAAQQYERRPVQHLSILYAEWIY